MNWVCNAKRPIEFSILLIAIKQSFKSAFLQTTMIPARHRVHVFLSIQNFETLRRICWDCTTFDSVRDILFELSSSVVAEKAIFRMRSGIGMFFFSGKKAQLMFLRFCGPALLGKCIHYFRAGPSATQLSVLRKLFWICFASFNQPSG